ncbi:Uncharacterised protein [Mycobacterium tuberculosis]|uniref:Uncharacterized protein n=1 Tax=Mycobacterium tuberculosis TaxID=1773 RepID=A0A654TCJ6_MYCTX|nr:Uncharacterised protein [Mycobacterium tuberculosis]CNV43473.1 Uncharacterised protein [Mycobacterium tuberculosis]CNW05479.1 Uncharacterised protein [Mycobacterium tuberculosis]
MRDTIVCSPTLAAAWLMWSGVTGEPVKPSPLTYLAAVAALSWVCRDGALRVKYRCWSRIAAVSSAMTATKDSVIMPP